MVKTSKTVPQKEKASSSQPTVDKTLVEPRSEECVPGACVFTSDFKVDKVSSVPGRCLGKDAILRPPSGEEESSAPVPKSTKGNKRKRASTSEDLEPKTRMTRKPKRKIIPLTEESVRRLRDEDDEEENDGSILVARVKKTIDAPKAAGSMASVVHREACSRSRAELSQCEADLRRVTEERNTLKLLCGQREEEIRDLRAELAKAHQDQTEQVMIILKTHGLDYGTVANISISHLQQKLEVIGKLREEVDTIRAEALGWKDAMDRLAAKKETARAQLSFAESQLQGMKERSSVQARKIEELEARLASELAKARSETEKAKANADAFVVVYRAGAGATQVQASEAAKTAKTRAHWVAELVKCQSRRETLEEIHA
ncbi:uncharacterized protein [Nicotiana tomentosiformis]|uniref:uncharacterized protein n=1 Tax=Nicotiana tomentosiformis TaxID=4098 RepID=UPI00388C53B3